MFTSIQIAVEAHSQAAAANPAAAAAGSCASGWSGRGMRPSIGALSSRRCSV